MPAHASISSRIRSIGWRWPTSKSVKGCAARRSLKIRLRVMERTDRKVGAIPGCLDVCGLHPPDDALAPRSASSPVRGSIVSNTPLGGRSSAAKQSQSCQIAGNPGFRHAARRRNKANLRGFFIISRGRTCEGMLKPAPGSACGRAYVPRWALSRVEVARPPESRLRQRRSPRLRTEYFAAQSQGPYPTRFR
jgi:hypothetical protein